MYHHHSANQRQFVMLARFTRNTKTLADKLTKKNFKLVKRDQYTYQSILHDTKHTVTKISLECHNKCYCLCKSFVKQAVCLHLAPLSFLFSLEE